MNITASAATAPHTIPRLRLTLAYLAALAGVVALPRLAQRALPRHRRSRRQRHDARVVAADLGTLLLGVPAAYALAGHALRPIRAALAREERVTVAAAHELRTPMAALLGTLETALLRRRTPAQYEDVLRRVTEEAVHVSDLLDEVLTLAHVESGVDTPFSARLDLREVARAAVADVRPRAEGKGQTLAAALGGPLPVRGNGPTLRRALDSLLDNAVVHTPSGGAIRLTARRTRGQAALTVRDTGPGIAPEHLPHLCEPFYRLDPARTSDGDGRHAGLGLSRAARIARAHDGRLTIASQVGVGSVFTLSLPLDRSLPGRVGALGGGDRVHLARRRAVSDG